MRVVNSILWLSMLWLPALLYAILKNEAKFKKNLVCGVTFPREGQDSAKVKEILSRYQKEEKALCLILTAVGLFVALLPVSMGVSMTVLLIWIDCVVALPGVFYARCNRRLKREKEQSGWTGAGRESVTVDLKTAGIAPARELKLLHFVPPFFISLIPCILEFVHGGLLWGGILLINPACVVLFYLCYRFVFRRKSERVDDNAQLTEALTRLRYVFWRRMWLYSGWFLAVISIGMWGSLYDPVAAMIGIALATTGFVIVVLRMEFGLRHAQERLTKESGTGVLVDEDDAWIWGLFYYNPNDSKLVVNQRTGGNVTFNLAKRAGRVIMAATLLILLLMPLTGVWLIAEENASVVCAVERGKLVSAHLASKYEIPLAEVESVALLSEKPSLRKVAGTGTDNVQKGRYRSPEYGEVTVCLDPGEGPWLLIGTKDGSVYLVGGGDTGPMQDIYETLTALTK